MTGAQELSYKRYFKIQERLFHMIGFDLANKSMKHPYLIVSPPLIFSMSLFWVSWQNRRDTDVATEVLASGVDMTITFLKALNFVQNQEKFLALIHIMWTMSKTDDVEEYDVIRDLNTKAKYISRSLVVIGYGAFSAGCITPYIITAVVFLKTGTMNFTPVNTHISIEDSEPWQYAVIHIVIVIFIFIGTTSSLAIDTLYIWFVFNLMAQFRILNMRFKRTTILLTDLDIEIHRAFRECIRFHQSIIEFADNFDLAYRRINFFQFALGCLPFSFLGFQLTMGSGNKMFYVVYMICKLFQIALYCALGQKIQDESGNVAENIYETFDWEKLSKKSRQLLLITMTRAQKCCNLTGIFFVIDISLFVWVYRTTTSYITILWTLAANAKE